MLYFYLFVIYPMKGTFWSEEHYNKIQDGKNKRYKCPKEKQVQCTT